ncbi:amidotransferase subunit B [Syncephalastrum racemosum]|uniref:Glutamyl-tRNA(Gln) amidotransferase subunit B, mitochondrial n=1 Tax=Syncephalastrum racemosum TaxID=13706 RepID=A0A1X2H2S3_SYNRA|nr:amidotransferase subunit B [Syncephalastrum racemosum]
MLRSGFGSIRRTFSPARSSCICHARLFTTRQVRPGWEAVIGIEVHAQIDSKTKLFSDTPTSFDEAVNTKVSLVDLAFPGVQPRLNSTCVEMAVKTALALNSNVQLRSSFDRKHYFYPDLPQGYQITQHREPIARGGHLTLTKLDGVVEPITVRLDQIQLEQDTGKSFHDMEPGVTLLDMNRAGTGLMEIVTQPDLRTANEAALLAKKLQAVLRCIGSSQANMSEGSMRCDVNVSVRRTGAPFGTRCEVKNLNSVRFLAMAIEAEIDRQIEVLENGGQIVPETRGFDVAARKTFKLRSKETAPDYRYMPEPDLPPLCLSQTYVDQLAATLPELPDQCRDRIMQQYDLNVDDANTLLNEPGSLVYFEELAKGRQVNIVRNWTLHELFGQLAGQDIPFEQNPVSVSQMGGLVDLVQDKKITGPTAKKVLRLMLESEHGVMPQVIVEQRGWARQGDAQALTELCQKLADAHKDKADAVRSGTLKFFPWFIGQAMRESKGRADPVELNKILCDLLGCKPEDVAALSKKKKKN